MFVLAALLAVAASSLDLLARTSILCTEETAAAFTSFPVSLVGAVLRRSSAMLAIPLKKAFYLEKRGGEDSDGRSGEKKKRKERKRRKGEKRKKKILYSPMLAPLRFSSTFTASATENK